MSVRKRSIVLAVIVSGLLSPSTFAQTRGPAIATELFNAGRDLMKKGDFTSACPKLATSLQLDPKVGTMAKLAECEEQIGQLANARAHWSQAINLARSERDDRLPKIESEWKRLDGLVPKVDVELGTNPPAGAGLRVDGIDLGSASFGVAVPIDPGAHTVVVTARGKQDWTHVVQAQRDGIVTRLDVPALADALTPVVAAPSAPVDGATAIGPAAPSRSLRTAAFVTGGAGIAAVGAGAIFGLVANAKLGDSNRDGCNGNSCSQPGYGERNDARTFGDLSTGFFIAGGALVAAGITVWVLSTRTEHPVAVAAGPASLQLSGTF
jgi:hypothetical protein